MVVTLDVSQLDTSEVKIDVRKNIELMSETLDVSQLDTLEAKFDDEPNI